MSSGAAHILLGNHLLQHLQGVVVLQCFGQCCSSSICYSIDTKAGMERTGVAYTALVDIQYMAVQIKCGVSGSYVRILSWDKPAIPYHYIVWYRILL